MGALRPHPRGSGIPGHAHRAARALRPARSPDARRRGRPRPFHQLLHHRGARVVVADLSARQLELNRETARVRGFASSVEAWRQLDICDLGALDATSFDGVVAFGGPFSYVFERRDKALAECVRVLRPGGYLLLSVMSLWGTLNRH